VSLPATEPARFRDIDWRWALPRIAAVFIVTRLLVLAVAVAVETVEPPPPQGVRIDERPILASLTSWDGEWYLSIAETGYHAEFDDFPDYAFFPAYPVTIRALSFLTGGDLALASVLSSNLAFGLALIVLYALSVRHLTPPRAVLSLWFLALAPGAIGFTLSYSESLFLLLAAGAFLAAEWRRPWLVGLALAVAAVARAPGVLLLVPIVVLYVQRDGWRPTRDWLPLLLAPAALALYLGYLGWLTGDPLAPINAQVFWDDFGGSLEAATATGANGAEVVSGTVIESPVDILLNPLVAMSLAAIAFYLFLFVYFRPDRIRAPYWIVAITAVVGVLLAGRPYSIARYFSVAWPFDWVLANRRSRIGRGLVLGMFAAGQVVLLWLAFDWRLAP
jgi:hypothetical protein